MLRCQRAGPGELRHVDTKKRGRIDGIGHRISGNRRDTRRGAGWEILHVAIDNAARLAYSEILPDERKVSAIAFLARACLVQPRRRHRPARHYRQRRGLPVARLPPRLRPRQATPGPHPTLHAAHQRQCIEMSHPHEFLPFR
jgi:hypothetical protein